MTPTSSAPRRRRRPSFCTSNGKALSAANATLKQGPLPFSWFPNWNWSYQRASRVKKVEYINGLYAIMSLKNALSTGSRFLSSGTCFARLRTSLERRTLRKTHGTLAAKSADRLHGGTLIGLTGWARRLAAAMLIFGLHISPSLLSQRCHVQLLHQNPPTIIHLVKGQCGEKSSCHGVAVSPALSRLRLLVHLRETPRAA